MDHDARHCGDAIPGRSLPPGPLTRRFQALAARIKVADAAPTRRAEEGEMAKYLLEVSYSADSMKAVIAKGGSARKAAAQTAVKSVGGKVDAFYFAFGDTDA